MGVNFDDTEAIVAIAAKSDNNELAVLPGGIVGFKIQYFQVACP